jgi:hypothetical protein
MVGEVVCCRVWLPAKGSGSLRAGVFVCEWEWLFVAGSGFLR